MSETGMDSPSDLLKAAHEILERTDAGSSGVWSRASALLGRQALERWLAELWRRQAPGTEEASMRAQLICLPRYLEPRLAGRVAYVWGALSNACHQHAYELAPSVAELRRWLDVVGELGEVPSEPPGAFNTEM